LPGPSAALRNLVLVLRAGGNFMSATEAA